MTLFVGHTVHHPRGGHDKIRAPVYGMALAVTDGSTRNETKVSSAKLLAVYSCALKTFVMTCTSDMLIINLRAGPVADPHAACVDVLYPAALALRGDVRPYD